MNVNKVVQIDLLCNATTCPCGLRGPPPLLGMAGV